MSKYINPYTDFGFKKLFGEEANKDLLMDFLNQLVEPEHQIASLTFKNPEKLPNTVEERKAVYDIFCISTSGERFIVEMQKAQMHFFKDRSLFYTTFPIREQAKKGRKWNFELQTVYFVAILDFEYDEAEERQKFRRDVALKDQDGDIFYNKLHFKFLQMPLFNKQAHELETKFDKWCYFLKNLADFDNIPAIFNEPIFEKAFHASEVAAMTAEQYVIYEQSLISYWDMHSVVETAEFKAEQRGMARGMERGMKKGMEKGMEKGMDLRNIEVAKNAIVKGADNQFIADITGLSNEQIQTLRNSMNK